MRWILMEDGGRKSLFDFFKEADFDKNVIRPRIKKSVDLLIALSKVNADFFPFQFCIKNEFDKENILFDLRYYNKFYLEERGMPMNGEKMEALAREIHSLLEGNFPKVLMHRIIRRPTC
jgi:hypothetical protein